MGLMKRSEFISKIFEFIERNIGQEKGKFLGKVKSDITWTYPFVERRHSQSSYLQLVEQRSIVMDNLFSRLVIGFT